MSSILASVVVVFINIVWVARAPGAIRHAGGGVIDLSIDEARMSRHRASCVAFSASQERIANVGQSRANA